ncbi:MAG: biopolymer transporter ExbD [Pseudomonadota bacterium]
MRRRWRQRRQTEQAELNITAFMNLMVILVPFLLITAVFSRTAVLELNLPGPSSEPQVNEEESFNLEVTVRAARIDVSDRNTGLLKSLPNTDDGYDLDGLRVYLKQVKARYPDKLDATILLEADIVYDTVVQVMDSVRVAPVDEPGGGYGELFPEIAIGDAPVEALSSALTED